MIAVKNNPKIYQNIGKNLKDDEEIFKLAFHENKEILRYASERLQKIIIQSQIYRTQFC